MYDKKLAYRVKKFLESNSRNYRIKDISRALKLRKHKFKDLIHTLKKMAKEKEIAYKHHKYAGLKQTKIRKVIGTFDATALARDKSFAFVRADENDIYISAEDCLNAYHNDTVEVEVSYSRRGKRYGKIIRIIKRYTNEFVGRLEKYRGNNYLMVDSSKIHTDFTVNDPDGGKPGDKVVLKVTGWGKQDHYQKPFGNVIEVLGKAGDPDVEILSVIKQFDLPLEFTKKVLAELDSISPQIDLDEINKRRDLRDLLTFTIDPESAKDYDDAISLVKNKEKTIVYVHIADVAHYVHPESELFREAVNRGNSYYFPRRVIPMLPEKISNKVCSLRPYEEKLTLTVEMVFNSELRILSQKTYESVIRSDGRFSYNEIDKLFAGKKLKIETEIKNALFQMRDLSKVISKQRKKDGYLFFDLPETQFIFDDEGHIVDLQRTKETDSHKLIENFMLLANEFIARKLSSQPTIFRIHEEPDKDKLKKLKETLGEIDTDFDLNQDTNKAIQKVLDDLPDHDHHRVFDKVILRSLMKAKYSVENKHHFGLALKYYTHFTSPIRRLSDLVIHHQLKNMLGSHEYKFPEQKLYDLAEICSDKELVADESEKEVDIKNKINFMKGKLGEEYEGIIISLSSTLFIVELDRYPVTGIVELSSIKNDYYKLYNNRLIGRRNGRTFKLIDKVKVLVNRVTEDIYFKIVD